MWTTWAYRSRRRSDRDREDDAGTGRSLARVESIDRMAENYRQMYLAALADEAAGIPTRYASQEYLEAHVALTTLAVEFRAALAEQEVTP